MLALATCIVCHKAAVRPVRGEPFNPQLRDLAMCHTHWGMWRDLFFRLPTLNRWVIIKGLQKYLSESKRSDFKSIFLVFWDLLQEGGGQKRDKEILAYLQASKGGANALE